MSKTSGCEAAGFRVWQSSEEPAYKDKRYKMRDIFYTEIRNRIEEIREADAKASIQETESQRTRLMDGIKKVSEIAEVAKRHGLLALKQDVQEKDEDPAWNYLIFLCGVIVDGTDPKSTEEMAFMRYYADDYTGYEGLLYLLYMMGMLEMQKGTNPHTIKQLALSLVPENVREAYEAYAE